MSFRDASHDDPPFSQANDVDEHESSGITSLLPVPVKTVRFDDLDESDRTQFFSVDQLLARRKSSLGSEASSEPSGPETATGAAAPPGMPKTRRSGPLQAFREASFARQASAVMLPLLLGLLLLKPVFRKPSQHAPGAPAAASIAKLKAPVLPRAAEVTSRPAAAAARPILPKGVSLERAAADSIAGGDFTRARALYRELSQHDPSNLAYREAARILEERARARTP
jgi:hypothetical protein